MVVNWEKKITHDEVENHRKMIRAWNDKQDRKSHLMSAGSVF